MRTDQVRTLIINWHDKAKVEKDIFSKFVFHWFCFNAWLAHESGRYHDREMLDWLKRDRTSSLRNAFYSMADRDGIEQLISLSPIRGDSSRRSGRERSNIHIANNHDLENTVEAVYRIRCNLFHGRKEPDDIRDQKLVDACGRILEGWIEALILEWRLDP